MSMNAPALDRSFVTPDGTRIAYGVSGSGSPLLLTNGLTTDTTFWKYLAPVWAQRHTVICWDLPGHGKSSPAFSPLTAAVESQPALMREILDRVGVERAVQVGWSTGCQLVLEMYRQAPERCTAVALLFGPAGHVLDTTRLPLPGSWFAPMIRGLPPLAFELLCRGISRAAVAPGAMRLCQALHLVGPDTREEDLLPVLQHIGKVDPATLRTMLLSLQAHSAEEVLPKMHVPLLIFSGDRDPFALSDRVGIRMHEAAPGSELIRVPNGMHTALLDEPEQIARAVEKLAQRALSS